MSNLYVVKFSDGIEQKITFDGVVYPRDILRFAAIDGEYVVTKRTLEIPSDIDEPITEVILEVERYTPDQPQTTQLPTPKVVDDSFIDLGNKLSKINNPSHVYIELDTTGLDAGTTVYGYFNVKDDTEWFLPGTVETGLPLRFRVEPSQYNSHVGKLAKVRCSIAGNSSQELLVAIVE